MWPRWTPVPANAAEAGWDWTRAAICAAQKEVDAANKKGKKGKKGVLGKLRARNDAQQAALDQRAREAAARPAVVHMRGTEGQARKAAHQREL